MKSGMRFLGSFLLLGASCMAADFRPGYDHRRPCEGSLDAGAWIPTNEELGQFQDFKEKRPQSFFFSHRQLFHGAVENSPKLRQALSIALFFLGSWRADSERTSSVDLISRTIEAFVNKGRFRFEFHDRLEAFFLRTVLQVESVDQLAGDYPAEIAGRRAEALFAVLWSEDSVENPVFSWTRGGSDIAAPGLKFFGEVKTPSGLIILDPKNSGPSVEAQLAQQREGPLVEFGQSIPDSLYFKLKALEGEFSRVRSAFAHLKDLARKAGVHSAFDAGAVNEISEMTDSKQRNQKARALLQGLLNSSQFFDAYKDFASTYTEFALQLSAELSSGFLSPEELASLRWIIEDKLILMSLELTNLNIDFQTVSPRYKEVNRSIGWANRDLRALLQGSVLDK